MSKNELKYIRILTICGLIIAILFFLSGSAWIGMTALFRECDRIAVTDANRKEMASMLEETIDLNKQWVPALADAGFKMPDMNRAKEIESHVGWHDYEITVYYEDGTDYSFYIKVGTSLTSLIQNEGYNVYFRSWEFVRDLIKVIIPLLVIVVAAILIRKLNVILIRKSQSGEKKYVGIKNNREGFDA